MRKDLDHDVTSLFEPFQLRDVTVRNRVWMSPMCQYSAADTGPATGAPTAWHATHLHSRAVGGAGLVIAEATAVTPEGRISPQDLGLWNDTQLEAFAPIVAQVAAAGATPGIQLAHAGRKASTYAPFATGSGSVPVEEGGWQTVAPSAEAFGHYAAPRALTGADLDALVEDFRAATRRAVAAGFEVIELHGAHGYLLHQFLSPAANHRTDEYGGDLEGRMRLPLRVVDAVREELPEALPLVVRLSATDWLPEGQGWDVDQSVELSRRLKEHGVNLVDVSSGGLDHRQQVEVGPGYQVPFAARIRREAGIATGAVGMITEPKQAQDILAAGEADAVLLARELLRDPYWPLHAAQALEVQPASTPWPKQYLRAL
ncbi:2,4-dienoyl-CoA reductase-like NADH-dependent reductase (Old Yellow Enzyme family) [Oryzihumus leptocrescens]|uniref:2,4-dienoyl-CoA reductase-like NADH-dependent reductase (Old Yellow Enzyme family) n=1 Tax=Oryzihumus leptocrescens TaxID=297536 RepID=A0A542ZHC6_9MICO|nr:2,4-dienoyl-CoA reductase-like NADH-dependent reductase (Old Yellow Enzyme family) [Oryzihumus leptocrescens]